MARALMRLALRVWYRRLTCPIPTKVRARSQYYHPPLRGNHERRIRGLFLIVGACLVCWYGFNYIVLRKQFQAFILFGIYFFAMGFGLLNIFGRSVIDLWNSLP